MLFYSYQYNLKIVGVLHVGETESSEETVKLCETVSISDIDIAHRVPQQNNTSSNGRRRPNPIICKFTRRMAREKVLAAKSNTSTLTVDDLGLPTTATIDRIAIYSHLTPKLQSCCMPQKIIRSRSITSGVGRQYIFARQLHLHLITPAEINN